MANELADQGSLPLGVLGWVSSLRAVGERESSSIKFAKTSVVTSADSLVANTSRVANQSLILYGMDI